MSFQKGYGGGITVLRPANNLSLCVGSWGLSRKVEIEKKSNAGTRGIKIPTAGEIDYSGTIELPFDDEQTLEDADLIEGDYARLKLKIGGSTLHLYITVMIATVAYKVDNAAGPVMLSVTWEGAGPLTGPR